MQFKMLESEARKAMKILASIPDSVSLDLFLQAIYTLKKYNLQDVRINYLYGARSDKDKAGECAVANVADYVQRLIDGVSDTTLFIHNNSNNAKKLSSPTISVLAPHCKLPDSIHSDYSLNYPDFNINTLRNYDMIVFPDESAYERFAHLIPEGGMFDVCEKHRDQVSGDIISHKIPELPENVGKILLIDDLCDFGNSFTNVGKSVPSSVKADLFIFHGVFTGNAIPRLLAYYEKIIVTNSLSAPEDQKSSLSAEDQERVQILNVW